DRREASDRRRDEHEESPRQPPPRVERRGPFTPFSGGKGSGKGYWGKGRFGDSPFGKGKGKGFGGKGWSSGSRGFVWKHDKFEEEMKAADDAPADAKEPENKESPKETSPAPTPGSKPIKFDLYAEKLDENVVQAVLDNVRERIDKRREVMKQKREERDAEIKRMIEAGEDPFAKRPREGERSAGLSRDQNAGRWVRGGPPQDGDEIIERPSSTSTIPSYSDPLGPA
ncbi:hypothetical protein FOZ62_007459, partial [Perkinsus olseni]